MNDGPTAASRILLWVALIQDMEPYQKVLSRQINPLEYKTITDEYENLYAEFEFIDISAGEMLNIQIQYTVLVNEIHFDLTNCTGFLLDSFTDAETYIESDTTQIIELSNSLTAQATDTCSQARAIYDYLGDNMVYSGYMSDDLGALSALENLEGDCTEFSDLYIALNRAADIPAHFLDGITCCTDDGYEAGSNKHNWTEVYLPNIGWVPVDPTWGRYTNDREKYFSGMTPDHIIITRGRNLDTLLGYHFYAYRYWWDGDDSTAVSSEEEWSIIKVLD
jgi:transglutaminase-like putative cysteine protease